MIKKILSKWIDLVFHLLMILLAMFLTFWLAIMVIMMVK